MHTMNDPVRPAPAPDSAAPVEASRPLVIQPNGLYSLQAAAQLLHDHLGIRRTCLRREAKLRRLKVSKRSGRLVTTGQWLLEWVHAGLLAPARRRKPATPDA
jgi:hypothetical protein